MLSPGVSRGWESGDEQATVCPFEALTVLRGPRTSQLASWSGGRAEPPLSRHLRTLAGDRGKGGSGKAPVNVAFRELTESCRSLGFCLAEKGRVICFGQRREPGERNGPIHQGLLVLDENSLGLEGRVLLQVLQRERVGPGEKVVRFECHLEELKSDVVGECLRPAPQVLCSLECVKPLMSFFDSHFKIPVVGELLSSWPFCKAATLFPPPPHSGTWLGVGSSPYLARWFSTQ